MCLFPDVGGAGQEDWIWYYLDDFVTAEPILSKSSQKRCHISWPLKLNTRLEIEVVFCSKLTVNIARKNTLYAYYNICPIVIGQNQTNNTKLYLTYIGSGIKNVLVSS